MNRTHWIIVGALAGGVVAMLGAGWQFLVHPISADIAAQVSAKADIEAKLQTARDTAAQFDKFRAQAENMRRDLDFYSSRMDANLTTIEVGQMLDTIAHELDLKDWTADVKPPSSAGANGVEIGACKVEVRFKSDYEHIGRFLNGCLDQVRLVVPDNVSLHDAAGVYFDTVDVDLNLTVWGGKGKGK